MFSHNSRWDALNPSTEYDPSSVNIAVEKGAEFLSIAHVRILRSYLGNVMGCWIYFSIIRLALNQRNEIPRLYVAGLPHDMYGWY
jgi:hypothetical protein